MPEAPLTPVPTLQRLCAELIALRERNDRQHKLFEQTLSQTRDDLQARFDKFAAEAQSAYQRLRDELTGERRLSLALLTALLDLALDIQKVADSRPTRTESPADVVELSRRSQVVLAQFGVHRYDAVIGSVYEPALHERVGSQPIEGMGSLRVAAQVEPGYASQQPDFVLRRAKVMISE
jgi:molecular chaperone GrpE (heat shock protein)